ncbi:MAG: hypothetical protein ACKVQK_03150 [Burkholderiales bacterium]
MLNRSILIVRPRQPFIDWVAGLDGDPTPPTADGEQTVYLIPAYEDEDEAEAVLEAVWEDVFEKELWSWHTTEADWPKPRTLELFRQWFDIEMHSVVEDVCGYEIADDGL